MGLEATETGTGGGEDLRTDSIIEELVENG